MQTPNDCIHLAIRDAVRGFGGSDGTFNLAGLSVAICRIANVAGPIDGNICRALLTGRPDVEPLRGGAHYRMLEIGADDH